jgi:hypothetical protein
MVPRDARVIPAKDASGSEVWNEPLAPPLGTSSVPATLRSEQKLGELLPRIAANDREVEYINGHALPSEGERLLVAELVARGIPGFVENGVPIPRITQHLRLPAFEYSAHDPFAWPRSR